MKISTFEHMMSEFGPEDKGFDDKDLDLRNNYLKDYKHSFIVEGEATEFNSLYKWLEINIRIKFQSIFYGKTAYEYHFAEFFLKSDNDLQLIKAAIPNIYTTYPSSYSNNKKVLKSDGPLFNKEYSNDLNYHDAIIF